MTDIPEQGLAITTTPGIDPLDALATSMYASPGLYAVLLGAGMSISAGMLSAWGILYDLIRQVAQSENGEVPDTNEGLEDWWEERTGSRPHYGEVLEKLERKPSALQRRLHRYFVPIAGDPSNVETAHNILADVCSGGFVRVILTTNFDDLIERALKSKDVDFQVRTPATISGMTPLVHSNTSVVKLHGDYQSADILNTPGELSEYSSEVEGLLREILRDFGLVVVGWSAEWDEALRRLIDASPVRRYPLYWVSHNDEMTDKAGMLVSNQQGQIIRSTGADEFFLQLKKRMDRLSQTAARETRPTFLRFGQAYSPLNQYQPSEDGSALWLRTAVTIGPASIHDSDVITPAEREEIISRIDPHRLSNGLRELALTGSFFTRLPPRWHNERLEHWHIADFIQPTGDSVSFELGFGDLTARLIVSGPAHANGGNFLAILDIGMARQRTSLEEVATIFIESLEMLTGPLYQALIPVIPSYASPDQIELYAVLPRQMRNGENDIRQFLDLDNWGQPIRSNAAPITDLGVSLQIGGALTRQGATDLVVRSFERIALNNGFNSYGPAIERLRNILTVAT